MGVYTLATWIMLYIDFAFKMKASIRMGKPFNNSLLIGTHSNMTYLPTSISVTGTEHGIMDKNG